jgi:hypothetical protein
VFSSYTNTILTRHDAIRKHIIDRYNSGKIVPDLNIIQVDFESISAKIVKQAGESL